LDISIARVFIDRYAFSFVWPSGLDIAISAMCIYALRARWGVYGGYVRARVWGIYMPGYWIVIGNMLL
jgi:hypothetical protein